MWGVIPVAPCFFILKPLEAFKIIKGYNYTTLVIKTLNSAMLSIILAIKINCDINIFRYK